MMCSVKNSCKNGVILGRIYCVATAVIANLDSASSVSDRERRISSWIASCSTGQEGGYK